MVMPPLPDGLEMWTVYDHPADHPNEFVARMWIVPAAGHNHEPVATGQTMSSSDLEWIRKFMRHRGLACIARSPDDDPVIVETWL